MAPVGSQIHQLGSLPKLDFSGALIEGNIEERNPTIRLPNWSDEISHLALDIGGSLIKLVYFSIHDNNPTDHQKRWSMRRRMRVSSSIITRTYPMLDGRLHFINFETSKLCQCLDFIDAKQLLGGGESATIKATGGGAHKFADTFKERLGIRLDKEDEMECVVAGANFLLKSIPGEAFTHMDSKKKFVQIDQDDLFPYLLVNIGSGVSMIKVDGDGSFQRVSGTNVGGATYWGLGRLLTKCKSFDELLELSEKGDRAVVDTIVGDINGGLDYSKTELLDYRPEDISLFLLRMISYNIGQISCLNALRYGLNRIIFGGFFIHGHACTMNTISSAVHFWSKGQAQAMFLRHEGFLGALGAFVI